MDTTLIYLTANDEAPLRDLGEEGELITRGDRPKIGDEIDMGAGRLWKVVQVEAYCHADGFRTLYVAIVVPPDGEEDAADPAQWYPTEMRDAYPEQNFFVTLAMPELTPIHYGWRILGQPLELGPIYGWQMVDGQPTSVDTGYRVVHVETFVPEEQPAFFKAVQLGLSAYASTGGEGVV